MKLNVFAILMLLNIYSVLSQEKIEIFNLDYPDTNVINMGPCYYGDVLTTYFAIHSSINQELYFRPVAPTYLNENNDEIEQGDLEFRQFGFFPGREITFNEEKCCDTIPIVFIHNNNEFIGWNSAINTFGLMKSNEELYENIKFEFTLLAKKTLDFLASFDDELHFDSVYVNPVNPKTMKARIKSTHLDDMQIASQNYKTLGAGTQENEFIVNKFSTNPLFPKKYQIVTWNIDYSPKDIGTDSSLFFIEYVPKPLEKPDSLASVDVYLYGTGVKQEIRIETANVAIQKDTLDIGTIRLGDTFNLEVTFKNIGNIPFNALNETIFNDYNNTISNIAQITSGFVDRTQNLYPDNFHKTMLSISSSSRGSFLLRYEITSDILNRKIYGVPAKAQKLVYYIKGQFISPEIVIPRDTIDLGNYYLNLPDCPISKDTSILIRNIGNANLSISNISTLPADGIVFPVNSSMEIGNNSSAFLQLRVQPQSFSVGSYIAEIILETNQAPPYDSVSLYVKVNILPPLNAELTMPNLSAKPGRIIQIPLLLHNELYTPSIFANNFFVRITYDSTILRYQNRSTLNTASEGAKISIEHLDAGTFDIEIENTTAFFGASDTLIFLYFRTYLGNTIESPLSMSLYNVGDNNCTKIMEIHGINSSFLIDSVCGLDLKAQPITNNKFDLRLESKNPSEKYLLLTIDTPFDVNTIVSIYDVYGNEVKRLIDQQLPEGSHLYSDELNLANGIYFITMRADIYSKTITFVLKR